MSRLPDRRNRTESRRRRQTTDSFEGSASGWRGARRATVSVSGRDSTGSGDSCRFGRRRVAEGMSASVLPAGAGRGDRRGLGWHRPPRVPSGPLPGGRKPLVNGFTVLLSRTHWGANTRTATPPGAICPLGPAAWPSLARARDESPHRRSGRLSSTACPEPFVCTARAAGVRLGADDDSPPGHDLR